MNELIQRVIGFMANQKATIADLRAKLTEVSTEYQNFQLEEQNEDAEFTKMQEELAAGMAAAAE
jgi:hypothetical protein